MNSARGFISISVDMDAVREALSRLEPEQQNKALKKALKATAKQARAKLAEKAQDSYTVTDAGFTRAMRIRATSSSAAIRAKGEPLPLKNFKTSVSGGTLKAQVLKRGRLKPLVSRRGGIKAFLNNIAKRGQVRGRDTKKGKKGSAVRHTAIAQRKGNERLEINEKYSNSIPVMIGSLKHVYGVAEPEIGADLQENLRRFVDQALGG